MFPVFQGQVISTSYNSPGATTYIVIGNAGNVEGLTKSWEKDTPAYLAYRDDTDYGYALLSVENATTLHWSYYHSSTNDLMDSITLTRSLPWME